MTTPHERWIRRYRPRPRARACLVCAAHAGGSAAIFRPWAERLPDTIELWAVELPGRGGRRKEGPATTMAEIVEGLTEAVRQGRTPPLALFGHSMGALVAFEVARRLRDGGHPPVHLFVSGHRAPQIPDPARPVHRLPDALLLEELRALNGTPPEIFEHPDLIELTLPIVRADFQVCETYRYRAGAPLACPITAFGGDRDALVDATALGAWREQTTGDFIVRTIAGDHFFVYGDAGPVPGYLALDLERSLAPRV